MSFLFPQKSWGKAVGSTLGLLFAGPWGAAFGFLIGHMHDVQNGLDIENLWGNTRDFSNNSPQAIFTMGVVVLGAKMAKSDGKVSRAEIEAFKRVFHVTPGQEEAIAHVFDQARLSAEGFEPYAFRLANVFQHSPAVLEGILSGLFIIGAADSIGLSPAETVFLKRVSFIFGFSAEAFDRIAARSGVKNPEREKPRSPTIEAYAILGIIETATVEEIKIAYRLLIREHHPDKLMAQGMAPAFIATATEKMKRINGAYDSVCRMRGIK